METYCQNPFCQNEAVREVPVSVQEPSDELRALCETCAEVYTWGVQHGEMGARDTVAKVRGTVERVLDGLDVGGEQSRQFAEEIELLREIIES